MIFKHFEPPLISVHFVLLFVPPAFATVFMAQHLSILLAVSSAYSLFYTALLLSVIIYRISPIHPLSRYPGPLHLKISKLSMAWVAASGKQHIYISRLHERYGDAVRVGKYKVRCVTQLRMNELGLQAPTKCRSAIQPQSSLSWVAVDSLKDHVGSVRSEYDYTWLLMFVESGLQIGKDVHLTLLLRRSLLHPTRANTHVVVNSGIVHSPLLH